MRRVLSTITAVIVLIACCFFHSCKPKKELIPSADFAAFISAYSGGMMKKGSTVVVQFMEEQPDEVWKSDVKDKLFSFSPSIKGEAHWVNSNTIEFVPEEGALKSGTLYNATFALGKVLKVEKKLSSFDFSFRVEESDFKLTTAPVEIQLDNTVTVKGEVAFSDMMTLDKVKKMIGAEFEDKKIDVAVEGQDNSRTFQFLVKGIARKEKYQNLTITVDGESVGIDRKESKRVGIPELNNFKLLYHEVLDGPESGVCLVFSDLISESQNLRSMITPQNISNYTIQVRANQVIIYFSRVADMKRFEVRLDEGLKNRMDIPLGKTTNYVVSLERIKPSVEILSSGTIMPGSDNLIIPFSAVSLRAVDLKIIRIFESNVLMFLQDNSLSEKSSYQLRRAGRLIHKQTLRLDTDPSKDIATWETYSLDLTKMIKQQPGAIYRIELSFKKNYAVHDCEDEVEAAIALNDARDLTRINVDTSVDEDSEEEAYWDSPDSYYYEGYDMKIDWNRYDWREEDNPCHPTYYMQSHRKAMTNVLASNLGLIAKSNSNNMIWATVTNILDTKPVAGAKVTAYNYQLQMIGSGMTDENGFSVLPFKGKPFVIVAESGDHKTYLRMVDGEENMLSRFDVGGTELEKGLKGYIYGERGVWRPGDTLHLAFMLEDRERKIPANHPVSLEIYNPLGQFYKKAISTNGLNGLYTFDISTKADDPTGQWNAYIKVGGATFHKGLRVETIKPNRLKINLDLPGLIDVSKGTATVGIHSQWLTGAIARNLSAKMELVLSKRTTQFKGYENYIFNNPAINFTSSTTEIFDGKLNDNGDASFSMNIPKAENAPGLLSANITCRVFEPGGDASIFSESVPFSPFSSYVGINFNKKKSDNYMMTDEDHVFDVVTLSPDGKPVNRNDIEYYIYRIGWSWWWEHSGETFDSYINNSNYRPLFSGKLNTTNGKGQIKFRINYPDWGRYLVFVKDKSSGHATGGAILVDWPSWRGRSSKSDPGGLKMLTFTLDKSAYEVGETVEVTIPATASESRALVALENGSEVLQREWVNMTAGEDQKYTFKVTEKMTPNVYVHISLLQPHASAEDMPIRMYGVMPVFVSNKESVLTPVITMTDVLRPETEFEVKVKEQNGKPMTYTLAIVDDGLLDITNFKTPDPWNVFYAREALGIRTWDMFDNVMGAYSGRYGSLFSIGGDGDLDNSSSKANRFKPVVLYMGPITLGAGKENKHSLRLPPYIGSVRVMVVAGQNGAYGNADKTVTVRSPLMLLSSLPRVLSTNEKISLPVNIFAMEDNVKSVTVKVETTGKLKAADGDSKSLTFTAPGDEIIYFPMFTGSETGIEKVTITATGGGHTSKETIEIDVRNPNPPSIIFESKVLEKGQSIEFDYELDGEYEGNWVKAEISRIPSVDLSRRYDYLYDYNHYCTEQLTSRALPLIFMPDFKEMDEQEAEKNKTNITEAINNLYGRQLSNGGFSYWPGEGYINDWASSYAGSFLAMAKERGYNVSSSVMNKWIGYQRSISQNWQTNDKSNRRYSYDQSDFMQAYRLYTLALAGAPEMAAMNRLKEVKNLSQQARWRLAAAYALCGKQDAAGELVFNASTSVTPYSSNNPSYGSSYRDESMILEALVLMGKNEEAFKQAQKVSHNLSGEKYFNTQSTAYAMVAMGQFASKMSGKFDFEWYLNGTKQGKVNTTRAVFQKQLPTNPKSGKVRVENGNGGIVYFGLTTKTRPIVDNLPASAENIKLDVTYTNMNGTPISVADLSQGTDFYAVIKVSNISGINTYTDVALTHYIPSGWEIYNERMVAASVSESGSTESTPNVFTYQDIRDDCVMTYFDLPVGKYKEIKVRLQATYIGEFVFPAIQCEAMYDPSARARTTAGRVTVNK